MSFSKISLWFSCVCISIVALFYYPKWNKEGSEATISWDVSGYYWYLPAFLIYHDVKQISFTQNILNQYKPTPELLQAFKHPKGNFVFKYSSGQAILLLPGFLLGHTAAHLFDFPLDGFSKPYQFGIFIWALLVTLIGLIILRKILLSFFSETATGLTILTICFATNFLEYGAITNAMTHNFLFTLYAGLIWATIKFYSHPSYRTAMVIGAIAGLMALTRPSEIICIIIPIIYGMVFTPKGVRERISWFINKVLPYIVLAGVTASVIGFIQPLYWKYTTGEWIVYSYEDQGFSWLHPHVYDCLFSGRAGWLVYTPVMILSLVGFVPFYKKYKNLSLGFLMFSLIFFYITFAWDIWWYGGSVSQRALVQLYPVLAFPLSAFYEKFTTVDVKAIILTAFGLFCVQYNVWMTHQCHYGGMFVAGDMTSEYLKAIFLKNQLPAEAKKLLDTRKIYQGDIKNPILMIDQQDSVYTGKWCLNDSLQFSPSRKIKLPSHEGWLRASADFHTDQKEWDVWKMTQIVLKYYKNGKELRSDVLRVQRHLDQGQKVTLWLDSKLRNAPDEVELFIWNAGSHATICVENLRLIYHKD
jgi:hypothetical protein